MSDPTRDQKLKQVKLLIEQACDDRGNPNVQRESALAACRIIREHKLLPLSQDEIRAKILASGRSEATPPAPAPAARKPRATRAPPPPAPPPWDIPDPPDLPDLPDLPFTARSGVQRRSHARKDGQCRWCRGHYLRGDDIVWEQDYGYLHPMCADERALSREFGGNRG
jgi:hypothetical protein